MAKINEYLSYIQEQETDHFIGVDLDGTLAYYEGWVNGETIGRPIPRMISFVKHLITEGHKVKIFTARATDPRNVPAIKKWLLDNGLQDLEVTCVKDPMMKVFYDDKAVQVEKNTGRLLGSPDLVI